jgi:hypothetical protein
MPTQNVSIQDENTDYFLGIGSDGSLNTNSRQSGTWNIDTITGSITLPTGAATGSLQTVLDNDLLSFKSANHIDLLSLNTSIGSTNVDLVNIYNRLNDKSQFTKITDGTYTGSITSDGKIKCEIYTPIGSTTGTVIHIADHLTGYFAAVNASGNLQVVTPAPTPPVGTTAVSRTIGPSAEGGTTDDIYVITNTKVLTLQRLSGGGASTKQGRIDIYYDPNGTGVGMTIIDVIYTFGASDQHDLSGTYTGNGTRAIRLRRQNIGGGSTDMFARWEGYET